MRPLTAPALKLAETQRVIMTAIVPAETPIEDTLDSGFWAHVASQLRPGFRVEVEPEDGAYFAELRVMDVGRTWAKVALLRKIDLAPVEEPEDVPAGYAIKWLSPTAKYGVIREADRSEIKRGFPSKLQAADWLSKHVRAMAA